jgi:hypothetical protein
MSSSTTKEATAAPPTGAGLLRRIATAIGAWQENVSDRAHASGDARACAQGWTVTRSAGRFGFGARTYRDPRMNSLAARGKAARNGVQITHLDTVTVRGGA